jgi:hypothetical protein
MGQRLGAKIGFATQQKQYQVKNADMKNTIGVDGGLFQFSTRP